MAAGWAANPGPNEVPTRPLEVKRLLRATLRPTLLGEPVQMDFYARNGFRFLAVPAWLDSAALTLRCQQFRNIVRLDGTRARDTAIRTITDEHLDSETMLSAVARLENPRHRFVAELFWPHLPENEFGSIRRAGELGSAKVIQQFSNGNKNGVADSRHLHVRALAHHCLAIETEFKYLEKCGAVPESCWEAAIRTWRDLWNHNEFWEYMHGRSRAMDDPRLQKEDADKARSDLPRLILGPHELLAEKYASAERYEDCQRHLNLIMQSGFPEEIVRASTWNAVKGVAGTKLDDLCRRAKQDFDGFKERTDRVHFEQVLAPLLKEAEEIRDFLTGRLHLQDVYLEQSAFDQFVLNLKGSADNKLKFEGPERERNLLYGSKTLKRLLALPLSSQVRREINQAIHEDNEHLYSQFGMDASNLPQALECFFLSGTEADPDDSIVISMYRITDRRVKVDRVRRSAGVEVGWRIHRVLVPRSRQAKAAHGGTVEVPIAPAQFSPQQRKVAAQLESREKEQRARRSEQIRQRDFEIQAEDARQSAEMEARSKDFSACTNDANAAIARLKTEEQQTLAAKTKPMEMRLARIDAKHAPVLQAAQTRQADILKKVTGAEGVVRIEAPLALLILVIVALNSSLDIGTTAFALLGAVVLGRILRKVVKARATGPLARAKKAHLLERQACQEEKDVLCNEIAREFTQKRAKFQSAIDAVTQERANLKQEGKKKTEAIRKRWDERMAQSAAAFEQSTKALRSQLVIRTPVKKLEQQSQFPAYQAARKKGFQPGEKPSASEMEMTQAEWTQALIMMSR